MVGHTTYDRFAGKDMRYLLCMEEHVGFARHVARDAYNTNSHIANFQFNSYPPGPDVVNGKIWGESRATVTYINLS